MNQNISSLGTTALQIIEKVVLIAFILLVVFIFIIKASPKKSSDETEDSLHVVSETQIVSLWYSASGNEIHLIVQPYFFDTQQTQFNDNVINTALKMEHFTYYKFWIVNFTLPLVSFVDTESSVSVSADGKTTANVPISHLIVKSSPSHSTFLKTFFSPESLPAGYMKPYLLAFPSNIKWSEIQSVQIVLQGKKYELSRLLCLYKDFQEYLQNPHAGFWQKAAKKEK